MASAARNRLYLTICSERHLINIHRSGVFDHVFTCASSSTYSRVLTTPYSPRIFGVQRVGYYLRGMENPSCGDSSSSGTRDSGNDLRLVGCC